MGRAIVREPQAFLMDEPLSNLDAKLRVQMRAEIAASSTRSATTTIYVTHDQVEAMTMGDRVAVMRKGELQQVAEPQELYDRPVNLFVGGFIGSPAMNMVEATLERSNGDLVAVAGSAAHRSRRRDARRSTRARGRTRAGNVILGIRPEDLEDAALAPDTPADRRLEGRVELREALGSEIMVHFVIDAKPARTEEVAELAEDVFGEGRSSELTGARETESQVIGRFGARSRVLEGDAVEAAVDTRALHFFDPETGLGIYESKRKEPHEQRISGPLDWSPWPCPRSLP